MDAEAEGCTSQFLRCLTHGFLWQVITCKSELLVPANPTILDGVPDLTNLTYLNEPSILHGLNLRYAEDLIYTHAGPVLIAINPFKQVPTLRCWRHNLACRLWLQAYCDPPTLLICLIMELWLSSRVCVLLPWIECRDNLADAPSCMPGTIVHCGHCGEVCEQGNAA